MRQEQSWRIGDVFLVQNKDGAFTIGQIVGQEKDVLNSVSVTFFDIRIGAEKEVASVVLSLEKAFAVLFVTRDLLDSGAWRVVDHRRIAVPRERLPYEGLRRQGFVGAKIVGSANARDLLDAYRGLLPWDAWKDAMYFDKLLVSPDKKPERVLLKGEES